MVPDVYMRLSYDQYKALETQLQNYKDHETTHTTTGGFYHKALRLDIAGTTYEFQGPLVAEFPDPVATAVASPGDGTIQKVVPFMVGNGIDHTRNAHPWTPTCKKAKCWISPT